LENATKTFDKELNEIKLKSNEVIEELSHKCDDREVKLINEQLPRFALYEDYKGLYSKVVPPIVGF
jgi:hypothetical protein